MESKEGYLLVILGDIDFYLFDEEKKPIKFRSREAALQYMEITSEEKLNAKGMFIEPYEHYLDKL
jgi:hypothetical protein